MILIQNIYKRTNNVVHKGWLIMQYKAALETCDVNRDAVVEPLFLFNGAHIIKSKQPENGTAIALVPHLLRVRYGHLATNLTLAEVILPPTDLPDIDGGPHPSDAHTVTSTKFSVKGVPLRYTALVHSTVIGVAP
ncbi:hypothetical protein J6590_019931 [Homalodisca vitripennis]|nr:hypothetical protein J6590_019931 [Homalodisca vitripennis]